MTVKGYKAFTRSWTCKGKQYELGKTYHEDKVELCEHGMHFFKELKDLFQYYDYDPSMKLAMVEASGKVVQSSADSLCVTSDIKVIEEINVNSEAVQLEAVKGNGYAIKYIKNPSERVQLVAVKQDGWSIQFIKDPSEQVQLEAVKQNSEAIQYIKNPSERVQLKAVKQNGLVLRRIKNPSEGVRLEAVKQMSIYFNLLP